MAWGNKYRVTFINYEGATVTISFQVDGWGGGITALTPGVHPAKLSYHSYDKHQTIVGSTLEIQVVYESAVEELFVEEDHVIRVVASWAGALTWYGFITPFQYYKMMGDAPHYATFLATDQLGLLKNIDFRDTDGDPYYYINTELHFIGEILDKTGIEIGLVDGINIYDSQFDDDTDDSPLTQTYFYPERYWDSTNDTVANCYDVLEDILKKYGARISQVGSYWYLQRPNSMWTKYTRRVFNSNWVYGSTSTAYLQDNRSSEGWSWMFRPEITKLKRVGKVNVLADPGWKDNLIKNSTFDDFTQSGGALLYWTTSGTITLSDGYIDLLAANTPADHIECSNYLVGCGGLRFIMDFQATWASTTGAVIRMAFNFGSWWYTTSGWSSSADPYEYDVYTELSGTSMTAYATFIIDFPMINAANHFGGGDFLVRIYELDVDSASPSQSHLYIKNVRLEPTYISWWPDTFKTESENAGTSFNTIETTLNQVDADAVISNPAFGIYDSDTYYYSQKSATRRDEINDKYIIGDNTTVTTPVTIQKLLANQLLEATYTPKDIIRGSLRGDYGYNKALIEDGITDSYGYAKNYIAQEATWDLRKNEWYGTWIEIGPIYTDETTAWQSHTYGSAAITGPSIEITTNTVSGTDTATSNAYTAVLGEMVRLVVTATQGGSSDLPNYDFDGQTGTLAWGVNYLEFRCGTAGSKTLVINHTDGETATCIVSYAMYSLKGI